MGFHYTTRRHLPDLFDPLLATRTAERMADRGAQHMLDLTVRNTPIGGRDLIGGEGASAGQGGGNLRSSWHQKPVVVLFSATGDRVYESGVETDVDYAPDVEHGTGRYGPSGAPYEIRPKRPGGWLSWITREPITLRDGTVIPPGTRVFRKRVMHPGSPGAHMVAIAAARTEAELEQVLEPELQRWRTQAERGR